MTPFAAVGTVVGGISAGGLVRAADQVVSHGPDLGGIAAIIAAVAGMISAIGAIIIGLRSKKPEPSTKEEVLMELLLEQLKEKDKDKGEET